MTIAAIDVYEPGCPPVTAIMHTGAIDGEIYHPRCLVIAITLQSLSSVLWGVIWTIAQVGDAVCTGNRKKDAYFTCAMTCRKRRSISIFLSLFAFCNELWMKTFTMRVALSVHNVLKRFRAVIFCFLAQLASISRQNILSMYALTALPSIINVKHKAL